MRFRLFAYLTVFVLLVSAKEDQYAYDKDLLSADFHRARRDALRALMPDSSVAVFFAAPVRNRANDVDYEYHQNPDFHYLSGYDEPNAVLLVFKEKRKIDTLYTDEILFVQDRDPLAEAWTGKRLGITGAKEFLKFKTPMLNTDFAKLDIHFKRFSKVFYFPLPLFDHTEQYDKGNLSSVLSHFSEKTEKLKNKDTRLLFQLMAMLRQIKQPEEMVIMRKAIDISCIGHLEVMRALEAGMTEYQAQAVAEYEFSKRGSSYCGYPSICGGGENSCILHYITNRKTLEGKNLFVIDAGAEYHGYTADITRTLPVDGKFSEEEKAIYNIVLDAQLAGIAACKSGNEFRAPHKAGLAIIIKRLKALGIISKDEDYVRYFFHGTSHYLGLDVHDPGMYGLLEPNNIITVEPGIYIPAGSPCDPKWWDIGIRIEDDVLITKGEPEVLSGALPKTVEAVEAAMAESSYLWPSIQLKEK
ncbi:MAG: aminopeptidase P family protein [Bacteroidia bacterium]